MERKKGTCQQRVQGLSLSSVTVFVVCLHHSGIQNVAFVLAATPVKHEWEGAGGGGESLRTLPSQERREKEGELGLEESCIATRFQLG